MDKARGNPTDGPKVDGASIRHDATEHDATEHDATEHDATEQDATEQDIAQQEVAEQGVTEQDAAAAKTLSTEESSARENVNPTEQSVAPAFDLAGPPDRGSDFDLPRDGRSEQWLHWTTLWLPCSEALLGLVVPTMVAVFFMPLNMMLFGLVTYAIVSVAQHVFRYFTFRYRLTNKELILYSGLIHRRERRIPFDRVQETKIVQGIIHRIFHLAKLEITTAGSDWKEATLNVVDMPIAEVLKATIDGIQHPSREFANRPNDAAFDFQFKLSAGELFLGGLTSNIVASIGAVIAAIIYFQTFVGFGSKWMARFEQGVQRRAEKDLPDELLGNWNDIGAQIPDLGPLNFIVDFYLNETLAKSLGLAVVGLIGSVLAYVVRYHGFRLIRHDELLGTSYGMLTLHRGSFSRDRIQALKIEEGLLRRAFSLASIRVDSAGDRKEIDEAKNRQVLVPVATQAASHAIARQAIPGLTDLQPKWRRVSRLAILRGSKKGWCIVTLILLQTYLIADWYCLAWLPAFPLVYLLNERWYRHTGYWLGNEHFLSRKGWINRSTFCLPVKNIQNVVLTQNYFDRRLQLATISIDTAGQANTGGGPVIRHLPLRRARRLQETLACRVGDSPFNW